MRDQRYPFSAVPHSLNCQDSTMGHDSLWINTCLLCFFISPKTSGLYTCSSISTWLEQSVQWWETGNIWTFCFKHIRLSLCRVRVYYARYGCWSAADPMLCRTDVLRGFLESPQPRHDLQESLFQISITGRGDESSQMATQKQLTKVLKLPLAKGFTVLSLSKQNTMVLPTVTKRCCVCSVDPTETHGLCCQAGWASVCLSLKETYLHRPVTIGKVINNRQWLLESWTSTECDISYQLAHSNNDLLEKTRGIVFFTWYQMWTDAYVYPTCGF